ncbi:MAG: hypothetical protein ACRDU4_20185, partial [Mycobacterium sp.]
DFSGANRSCPKGKGLFFESSAFPTPPAPPATGPTPANPPLASTNPCAVGIRQPILQAEWFDSHTDAVNAYRALLAAGWQENWLAGADTDTFLPADAADYFDGYYNGPVGHATKLRPIIALTAAGIAHFFAHAHVDFVDNLACHSMSLASAFAATTYVGHSNVACGNLEASDEPLLFSRLTGRYGMKYRTTAAAMAAGGFADSYFQIASGSQPVVLSPAAESVSPADGSKVTGTSTPVTVKFDARTDRPSAQSLISVSGCGAQITDAGTWSDDDSTLDFTVKTDPNSIDKQVTLTVNADQALAPGDGDNTRLSGNQQPSPQNGEEPNRTAYVWHLACHGATPAPAPPVAETTQPTTPSPTAAGDDKPVTITYTGSWKSNGTYLMDNPSQVHGDVQASG